MTERRLSLIEVKSLTAIEGHGPKRARWLCDKIKKEGIWSVPIRLSDQIILSWMVIIALKLLN